MCDCAPACRLPQEVAEKLADVMVHHLKAADAIADLLFTDAKLAPDAEELAARLSKVQKSVGGSLHIARTVSGLQARGRTALAHEFAGSPGR